MLGHISWAHRMMAANQQGEGKTRGNDVEWLQKTRFIRLKYVTDLRD